MLTILSLGAGKQSSTMGLMCKHGEITPMPDAGIFADTGAEPKHVMKWLDWLEKQLPFPVYRVMHKDGLREALMGDQSKRYGPPPFMTQGNGRLMRQCTREYKVEPITKKIRELMGLKKGQRSKKGIQVVQYIGISTDEASRMKPSLEHYIDHRWPLIELNMSVTDCMTWLDAHGYPRPGKSACTFCPYHDDLLWRDMKANDHDSWADAVAIDERIRSGIRGTNQPLYLHRSMKPLAEVDFRTAEDAGQLSMFNEECEGMCGV